MTQEAKKKRGAALGMIFGVVAAVMAVAFLPTTLVVVVCMVPTAVAFFVDSSRQKMLGPTVFVLNAAGTFPAVLGLWRHGQTVDAAIDILTQPLLLLLAFAPAGFGWILFLYTPYFVGGLMRRKAEARIRSLSKAQEALMEEWGAPVTNGVAKPATEGIKVSEAPQMPLGSA